MKAGGLRALAEAFNPLRSLAARLVLTLGGLLLVPFPLATVLLERSHRSVDAEVRAVVEGEAIRKAKAELHRLADARRDELEAETWQLARILAEAARLAAQALEAGPEPGLKARFDALLAGHRHATSLSVRTLSRAARVVPGRDPAELLAARRIPAAVHLGGGWPVRRPAREAPIAWEAAEPGQPSGRDGTVTVLAPVYRRDGTLVAEVGLDWAVEELLARGAARRRAGEEEAILDRRERRWLYWSSAERAEGPEPSGLVVDLAGALAGGGGVGSVDRPLRSGGTELLVSLRRLPGPEWDYVRFARVSAVREAAGARLAPAFDAVRRERRRALLSALLLGLLAATPAGIWVIRSLEPLRRLANAAEGIGSTGSVGAIGELGGNDELARLSRSLQGLGRRLERRDGHLRALSTLAREASASAGVAACCGQIARTAAGLAGAEKAFVYVWDAAARALVAVTPGFGIPDEALRGLEVREGAHSLALLSFETAQPYVSNEPFVDSMVSPPLARRVGLKRNVLFAPLRTEAGTTGVLVVADKDGPFDDDDEGAISAFADLAALLVRSAKLYVDLQGGYETLREGYRSRDRFVQDANHELRTPLTAILGWSEILSEDRPDPETTATAIGQIRRSAQYLDALIADFLDLERLQEGSARIERAPVDLGRLVREAVEPARGLAEGKGIEIRVAAPPDASSEVVVDGLRVRQVLWNLVHNAVKFTHRGGHVSIDAEVTGEAAFLGVTDDGIGIDPKDLPIIFDRFRQGEGGRARADRGSGIGLSLARAYVELHGGRIDVESGPGRGTRFTVRLPLGTAPELSRPGGCGPQRTG